jgi:ubiquinone/menaquinone biosynthesis C-methylase UbiE
MGKEFYWTEFIKELNLSLTPNCKFFDAGAGDGHWKNHIIVPIDYISMDLGVGDSKIDYTHLHINGDLKNIPIQDNSIDVIICIQVLEHVPEPWLVLKEFQRILKPSGFLFMSLPHSVPIHQEPFDFYRYTKYGVRYLLEMNNFQIEFIMPQLGNASKISNDIRMTGNLLIEKKSIIGYIYKVLAKFIDFVLVQFDQKYNLYNDTTGYFIKAIKK